MRINKDNYVGQKFGKLTINEVKKSNDYGHLICVCQCDCGNRTEVRLSNLKNSHTSSCGCGCVSKEERTLTNIKQRYFGLYKIWENIRNSVIPMDDEWRNSFISFRNWGINRRYKHNFDLTRIDKNKGFFPDNCKWIIHKKAKNCVTFYYKNKYWSLPDLADKFNMDKTILYKRVITSKWPVEKAVSTPVRKYIKEYLREQTMERDSETGRLCR